MNAPHQARQQVRPRLGTSSSWLIGSPQCPTRPAPNVRRACGGRTGGDAAGWAGARSQPDPVTATAADRTSTVKGVFGYMWSANSGRSAQRMTAGRPFLLPWKGESSHRADGVGISLGQGRHGFSPAPAPRGTQARRASPRPGSVREACPRCRSDGGRPGRLRWGVRVRKVRDERRHHRSAPLPPEVIIPRRAVRSWCRWTFGTVGWRHPRGASFFPAALPARSRPSGEGVSLARSETGPTRLGAEPPGASRAGRFLLVGPLRCRDPHRWVTIVRRAGADGDHRRPHRPALASPAARR